MLSEYKGVRGTRHHRDVVKLTSGHALYRLIQELLLCTELEIAATNPELLKRAA
jgi:hypothetical protein